MKSLYLSQLALELHRLQARVVAAEERLEQPELLHAARKLHLPHLQLALQAVVLELEVLDPNRAVGPAVLGVELQMKVGDKGELGDVRAESLPSSITR